MGILKKRLKTLSSPKCKKIKNIYLRRLAERAHLFGKLTRLMNLLIDSLSNQ
jgi:hypothetical protein